MRVWNTHSGMPACFRVSGKSDNASFSPPVGKVATDIRSSRRRSWFQRIRPWEYISRLLFSLYFFPNIYARSDRWYMYVLKFIKRSLRVLGNARVSEHERKIEGGNEKKVLSLKDLIWRDYYHNLTDYDNN